jgi:uncharacterized protein (TIGR02246 family)
MSTVAERVQRLEDIEAIRALDAEYTRRLDTADWEGLAGLFTPDGEFIGLDRASGHEELVAFFSGLAAGGLTAFWHYVTNLEIDLDGDAATVRSALWQPCVQGGVPHIAAGHYQDVVLRHGGRWRYRSKQVSFDYFTPLAEGWEHGRFSLDSARNTHSQ